MDILGSYKKMILSLIPDNLNRQLEKETGTVTEGIKYQFLASLVVVFFASIILMFSLYFINFILKSLGVFDLEVSILLLVFIIGIPIFTILSSLIVNAIMYVLAKILGGQGSYSKQFYHFSVWGGGYSIIYMLLLIPMFIPCVGYMVSILLELYSLYSSYLIYKSVHRLSTARAIVLTLLPIVLLFIILLVFFASFLSSLSSSIYN